MLTIPLRPGMLYPTAVERGLDGRRGAKSAAYKALSHDVEEAGRAAVAAGWETIAYPCRAWLTRYAPDARVRDPINHGSCEWNALTRAGVWTDDSLATTTLDVQPRSQPPDRVVIVIQRLSPIPGATARSPRPVAPKVARKASVAPAPRKSPSQPIQDLRSGDVLTFSQRDALLREIGVH